MEQETRIYRTFLISTSLAVILIVSAIFLGMFVRTRGMIHDELLMQARAHFDTMVKARAWNARYGGVYVEKKDGVRSNPYIEHPDIETKDGRVFTVRNPAMMTREISSLFELPGRLSFKITSLRPVNPLNSPDDFERSALESFEGGAKEAYRLVEIDGQSYFRYIAPLRTTQSCLVCHAKHGYRVGDIRGGISVTFSVGDIEKRLSANLMVLGAVCVATIGFLLILVRYFTGRLIRKLMDARKRIEELAVTDDLTGIYNRRYIIAKLEEEMERSRRKDRPLSCLMLDLDRFKSINDTLGHPAGDRVLRGVADRLREHARRYDTVGRYGGEEFMILLPETDLAAAVHFAERVCSQIGKEPIEETTVTVSIGVARQRKTDGSAYDIIKRADEALYRAKDTGRNCVVAEEEN